MYSLIDCSPRRQCSGPGVGVSQEASEVCAHQPSGQQLPHYCLWGWVSTGLCVDPSSSNSPLSPKCPSLQIVCLLLLCPFLPPSSPPLVFPHPHLSPSSFSSSSDTIWWDLNHLHPYIHSSAAIWDCRKVAGYNSCVQRVFSGRTVTSAYFSPLSGRKLLTTSLDNYIS